MFMHKIFCYGYLARRNIKALRNPKKRLGIAAASQVGKEYTTLSGPNISLKM
jgi:hypothetical protein